MDLNIYAVIFFSRTVSFPCNLFGFGYIFHKLWTITMFRSFYRFQMEGGLY